MSATCDDRRAGIARTSPLPRPRTVVAMGDSHFRDMFDLPRLNRLHHLCDVRGPLPAGSLDDALVRAELGEVEVLLTGWGCPPLDDDVLAAAPRLVAVFHAAGSVKTHIPPAGWARGLVVTSAADANAKPVAEFTLGTILLEGRRTWRYVEGYRQHRDGGDAWRRLVPPTLNHGAVVGLVGLSRVGRRVAELLRPFDVTVLVADPTAHASQAARVGATLVALDELLRCSDIVSLHAPELPETRHLLDRRRLALLRDDAVLINTARGALIDTEALIDACRDGRIRAILDVTEQEPLPAGSPLYELPSVQLTPHIAGAMHGEARRLADSALDELERFLDGRPLRHRVDAGRLSTMA
ncbi:hydroxyacid dehydrogenase [Jiangella anatolica]|uniref:Hydroxyacid dehydrogenase n=1 Tax=Jiangella anatolica TaxID=2670374 RepID=A0A2W2BQD0_9ACTN|nr:hydroxyacid dehydrogenase [Jiangella anatolica]PZF82564.1 hydroxyacid dehydrogenase [Jiangella anatolica]